MTTSTTEETGTIPAMATGEQPKPNKKAHVAARRAHVAPTKGKSAQKATSASKATKGKPATGTIPSAGGPRRTWAGR